MRTAALSVLLSASVLCVCYGQARHGQLSPRSSCEDKHQYCAGWAANGECEKNPGYMLPNCQISCHQCTPSGGNGSHTGGTGSTGSGSSSACQDQNSQCAAWAFTGECVVNPDYMLVHCAHSCDSCAPSGGTGSTGSGSSSGCQDRNSQCAAWASSGECVNNPAYMFVHCAHSCDSCDISIIG